MKLKDLDLYYEFTTYCSATKCLVFYSFLEESDIYLSVPIEFILIDVTVDDTYSLNELGVNDAIYDVHELKEDTILISPKVLNNEIKRTNKNND